MKVGNLSRIVYEIPESVVVVDGGVILIDFGRVAFGNIEVFPLSDKDCQLRVWFGEAFCRGRIDRNPPGSVRCQCTDVDFQRGGEWRLVSPGKDERNTGPRAVTLPPEWGTILPFRWVELEGWPQGEGFKEGSIRRRAAYVSDWNDSAAGFESSEGMLNRIWELCRYSIKATTFAGVYVDGDRERIPYEADAFLNQISHYACDAHVEMARKTFDHLLNAPTWPTEWAAHMIFMAHADWIFTGDTGWLRTRYDQLKEKLLPHRQREHGLLATVLSDIEEVRGDLVDWPPGERDGFVFSSRNAVVNAFQYRATICMAEIAGALELTEQEKGFRDQAAHLSGAFHRAFFDPVRGIYRDGKGIDHYSMHANLFPLAFSLVPQAYRKQVVGFLKSKGMACSVYAAQYLMEALFRSREAGYALDLMIAPGDRSWRHMVESGTTITWEAWDQCYKPNQDWNHAWGAAPVNLLPRFVLGVQPLEAGYKKVLIEPQLGWLAWARGRVPTVLGPLDVEVERKANGRIHVEFNPPSGMEVRVNL